MTKKLKLEKGIFISKVYEVNDDFWMTQNNAEYITSLIVKHAGNDSPGAIRYGEAEDNTLNIQ